MRLFALALFAITVACAQQTGTVTLTWDPMPAGQTWQKVRIYERTGAAAPYTYTLRSEVAGDQTTAQVQGVAPGVHTYVARAVDAWESADSNTAATPPVPQAPNLRVTVTVQVQ